MWANWEYILANTPFLRTVCSRQNAILANFRTQSVRNFQSIKNRRSHCFQVFDTWHKCELCCLIIYLFKKIYYICFLENQQKKKEDIYPAVFEVKIFCESSIPLNIVLSQKYIKHER